MRQVVNQMLRSTPAQTKDRMEGDLSKKTLEELIEVGTRKRLLDGWKIDGDTAHFQVGSVNVDLGAESAHAFVRGLIRGHEKAQQLAKNDGIIDD